MKSIQRRNSVSLGVHAPSNWEKFLDPDTGRIFFYHRIEGVTQWERPSELGSWSPSQLNMSSSFVAAAANSAETEEDSIEESFTTSPPRPSADVTSSTTIFNVLKQQPQATIHQQPQIHQPQIQPQQPPTHLKPPILEQPQIQPQLQQPQIQQQLQHLQEPSTLSTSYIIQMHDIGVETPRPAAKSAPSIQIDNTPTQSLPIVVIPTPIPAAAAAATVPVASSPPPPPQLFATTDSGVETIPRSITPDDFTISRPKSHLSVSSSQSILNHTIITPAVVTPRKTKPTNTTTTNPLPIPPPTSTSPSTATTTTTMAELNARKNKEFAELSIQTRLLIENEVVPLRERVSIASRDVHVLKRDFLITLHSRHTDPSLSMVRQFQYQVDDPNDLVPYEKLWSCLRARTANLVDIGTRLTGELKRTFAEILMDSLLAEPSCWPSELAELLAACESSPFLPLLMAAGDLQYSSLPSQELRNLAGWGLLFSQPTNDINNNNNDNNAELLCEEPPLEYISYVGVSRGQLYSLVSMLKKLPRDALHDDVYAALTGITRPLSSNVANASPFVLLRVFHTLDESRSNRVSDDDVAFLSRALDSSEHDTKTLQRIAHRANKEVDMLRRALSRSQAFYEAFSTVASAFNIPPTTNDNNELNEIARPQLSPPPPPPPTRAHHPSTTTITHSHLSSVVVNSQRGYGTVATTTARSNPPPSRGRHVMSPAAVASPNAAAVRTTTPSTASAATRAVIRRPIVARTTPTGYNRPLPSRSLQPSLWAESSAGNASLMFQKSLRGGGPPPVRSPIKAVTKSADADAAAAARVSGLRRFGGPVTSSEERGTFYGLYSKDEAKTLRSQGRTHSTVWKSSPPNHESNDRNTNNNDSSD